MCVAALCVCVWGRCCAIYARVTLMTISDSFFRKTHQHTMFKIDRYETALQGMARSRSRRGDVAAAILDLPLSLIKRLTLAHDADARETMILCYKLLLLPKFSDEEVERCVEDAGWKPGGDRVTGAMGKTGYGTVKTCFPFRPWRRRVSSFSRAWMTGSVHLSRTH